MAVLMVSYDMWCILEYADLAFFYSIMLQWSATKYQTPALKINTHQTITIKDIVVLHLSARVWPSSTSTFWSPLMSHLMLGLECIPVKIQSVFLMALMPLYPRHNKIDAERQFCLYLGTTTSGRQHKTDVFVISAHRQLATCDESVMRWYMHLNVTVTRGSIIQCGAILGTTL